MNCVTTVVGVERIIAPHPHNRIPSSLNGYVVFGYIISLLEHLNLLSLFDKNCYARKISLHWKDIVKVTL